MKHSPARILVTGCAGFLGSALCGRLIEKGQDVLCADNILQESGIMLPINHPQIELMRHGVTFPLYVEVDQIYNHRRSRRRFDQK